MHKPLKTALVVAAVVLTCWLMNRETVPQPKLSFGERAFQSFGPYLEKVLNAGDGFALSRPGDGETGWTQLTSNRWELRGYVINPGTNRVPWRAILRDDKTNCGVLLLEIDGKLIREAAPDALYRPDSGPSGWMRDN